MQEELQESNPARRRLQAPFLKKSQKAQPHPSPDRIPSKKQPFCRAAIAVKNSGRKLTEPPLAESGSKPSPFE